MLPPADVSSHFIGNWIYRVFKYALFAFAALILSFSCLADSVQVDRAWARATLPGQSNSAVFLRLRNMGSESAMVIAAKAKGVKAVEIHKHEQEAGMMRMREVPVLDVPAKGQQLFAPGGYHLMLFGVERALKAGETVELELWLDDDTTVGFVAPIVNIFDEQAYVSLLTQQSAE